MTSQSPPSIINGFNFLLKAYAKNIEPKITYKAKLINERLVTSFDVYTCTIWGNAVNG